VQWIKLHYPGLPVIAMTAHSTEAVNHRMSKLGFAAILHKPFSIEHFQRVVQQTGLPLFPITTANNIL
jgi:CheY-like chemotaxis protein